MLKIWLGNMIKSTEMCPVVTKATKASSSSIIIPPISRAAASSYSVGGVAQNLPVNFQVRQANRELPQKLYVKCQSGP